MLSVNVASFGNLMGTYVVDDDGHVTWIRMEDDPERSVKRLPGTSLTATVT